MEIISIMPYDYIATVTKFEMANKLIQSIILNVLNSLYT